MDPRQAELEEAAEILDECAALPVAEREAFLAIRCDGRPSLRLEVESLLTYLHDPEFEDDDEKNGETARALRRVGGEIGGCRLVELLAIGGMGAIYRAEQESPRREVALKLLRPDGLGTDAWRRLKREALALGRLDHPAIARVFTAGIHRDPHGATPFLTMELVEGGRPITEWWRTTALSIKARLALFATICDAVHHGHIKGVLHRDVKPANLLVDRDDRPKVIDFGIARVAEPGTDAATAPVTGGRVIGTIAYMSPERLEGGGEIDVRSDVYGLGVVLYELLTGRAPFGDPRGSLAATAAAVVRGDTRPPSTFDRRCRGDLDAIVARAMARDPAERYDSASALAADLRSHLFDEPIRARGVGTLVRIRKFLSRNLLAATAVAGIFAALATGLTFSLLATVRAERALYLSLLAQGNLTVARNDVGGAIRILGMLGPEHDHAWPVRMIRRFTDDSIDSAGFVAWNLFRGRLDATRGRLLASGWGDRAELAVLGTSPGAILGAIPLPAPGMGADWGPPRADGTETVIAGLVDGRVVEVRSGDGEVLAELTRVESDGEDRTSGLISDIALEPGGRRLAVGHTSDSVRIVDLSDGSIRDIDGFADAGGPNWVFVEWHPSGRSLAVAATGGTFLVDAETGSVRRLSIRSSNQSSFSPDGTRIATAVSGGGSEVIDVATGEVSLMCPATWPMWGVDWSRDGRHVAVTGRSHWIIVYDAENGARRSFKSTGQPSWTARWMTDHEFITLQGGQVFSLRMPPSRLSPMTRELGDPDRLETRMRFVDGDRSMICTGPDGEIDRVDPLLGSRTSLARMPVTSATSDATADGTIFVLADGREPGPLWVFQPRDGSSRRIDGEFRGPVALSPDGRRVVALDPRGDATVIEVASGQVVHRCERPIPAKTVSFAWIGEGTVAWCLPRGTAFLAEGGDGSWSLRWDPEASLLEAWPRGDGSWYWTDLGQRVLRSGPERLGDPSVRESLRDIGLVLCVAPHPSLPLVAAGMSDGRIVVFDESIEAIVANLNLTSRRLTDLAWSPDGAMLVSIDIAGGMFVFDSETLRNRWPEIERRRSVDARSGGASAPSDGPAGQDLPIVGSW